MGEWERMDLLPRNYSQKNSLTNSFVQNRVPVGNNGLLVTGAGEMSGVLLVVGLLCVPLFHVIGFGLKLINSRPAFG